MNFRVKFSEHGSSFRARFGSIQTASDGGFDRGFAEGYEKGESDGIEKGYADGKADGISEGYAQGKSDGYSEGLAARTYETWTITYADGSTEEKEVALL